VFHGKKSKSGWRSSPEGERNSKLKTWRGDYVNNEKNYGSYAPNCVP
jgi:hypothetical protein